MRHSIDVHRIEANDNGNGEDRVVGESLRGRGKGRSNWKMVQSINESQ